MYRSTPIAYFLTWTRHGTWLHGDERGSVDRDHKAFGMPFLPPDVGRVRLDRSQLDGSPVTLTGPARRTVEETIRRHAQLRQWTLHALNARTNHVHVVVSCGDTHANRALAELKAWTTRRLRESGFMPQGAAVWSHHGSTRYLWNENSVMAAVEYVCHRQGADLK